MSAAVDPTRVPIAVIEENATLLPDKYDKPIFSNLANGYK
jgi:hypothetical protein